MDQQRVNILVVDDDDLDVYLVKRAFSKLNITNTIYVAHDGVDALEKLQAETDPVPRPYIILLDINMPRMNGHEFLQHLRALPEHRDAAVFVLTTSNDDKDKSEAWNMNVAGYLLKRKMSEFMDVAVMLDRYSRTVELPA